MNVVDEIYELIKKDNSSDTFFNNIDLFQDFFYHYMSIQHNGPKVIDIYHYLLSINIGEEHYTMPYLNSKIMEDFNYYIRHVTQYCYISGSEFDDSYVDLLEKLIEEYYKFEEYDSYCELNHLMDEKIFVREYTNAMIAALNYSFFKISNDKIIQMVNIIKNNSYLRNIIEIGKNKKTLLDSDYIIQYVSKFLFNSEFVNVENIKNDILINAIKDGKINDMFTITKIIDNIYIGFFIEVFDYDISSLVDSLEKAFPNFYESKRLFDIIYKKVIEKSSNYSLFLRFIMKDERSDLYISNKEEIIKGICNNYPVPFTEEAANFVLNYEVDEVLLINLLSDCEYYNWSNATKEKILSKAPNISLDDMDKASAIKVLDSIFKHSDNVDFYMLFAALKRLIRTLLQDESVKIYLINDSSSNGCAVTEYNTIMLDYSLIKVLLETKDHESDPESLHILETSAHESRHIETFRDFKNGTLDEDLLIQYNDDVLVSILSNYYESNYFGLTFEQDARFVGSKMVVILLKKFFPYMKKSIAYYEKKMKSEENKVYGRAIFKLSKDVPLDTALDKLVVINPSIIKKFKFLQAEYEIDGTRKKEFNLDEVKMDN